MLPFNDGPWGRVQRCSQEKDLLFKTLFSVREACGSVAPPPGSVPNVPSFSEPVCPPGIIGPRLANAGGSWVVPVALRGFCRPHTATSLPSAPLARPGSGRHLTLVSVCSPSALPLSVPVRQGDLSGTTPSVSPPAASAPCAEGGAGHCNHPPSPGSSSSLCERRLLGRHLAVPGRRLAASLPGSPPRLWCSRQLFPPRSSAPCHLWTLGVIGARLSRTSASRKSHASRETSRWSESTLFANADTLTGFGDCPLGPTRRLTCWGHC